MNVSLKGINRQAGKLLLVLLALSLLVAAFPAAPAVAAPECRVWRQVRPGHTLAGFSAQYNINIDDLRQANGLKIKPYTIYVGQMLCIPAKAKPPKSKIPSYANTPAADFSARITNEGVQLKLVSFPANQAFRVKMSPTPDYNRNYTRVDRLRLDKSGSATVTVRLPKKFADLRTMSVCLKNTITDYNICRIAYRY